MSLAEKMMSMLRAKMSDSCLGFEGGRATLFTEQRALTRFWCVALWASSLFGGLISSAFGQSEVQFVEDGLICHVDLSWTKEDALKAWHKDGEPGASVVWQQAVSGVWPGVEVLHSEEVWEPLNEGDLTWLESHWKSKAKQPSIWTSFSVKGNNRLRWSGDVIAFQDGVWERLVQVSAVLGASPSATARVTRNWPERSVLADGTWVSFASTEEGVHCIGYDELTAVGLDPAELDPNRLRLFGRGGQSLPMDNDEPRPLDLPQQRVVLRGLDDGSFDPGDEMCWYASAHETWDWTEQDGWLHQPSFWGDTAKWFLRIDAPSDLIQTPVQINDPQVENPDEVRTRHTAFGVREDHTYNLIQSGRNWFGARLSALGSSTASWNIPLPNIVVGEDVTLRFAAAMRTTGVGTASQLRFESAGASTTLTDNVLSSSSLTHARFVSGEMQVPASSSGIQVLATLIPGTDDSNAWMDHLAYQAPQNLVFAGGQFAINGLPIDGSGAPVERVEYVLSGSTPDEVWDVTDPLEVKRMAVQGTSGNTVWRDVQLGETKRYLAFRWNAVNRPSPLGSVENSNVHALTDVDHVIVSTPALMPAADSLATLHAATGLRVAVVPQQDVFNAFSAGVSDPTAIKMLMMMLNDRAEQSMGVVSPPQHLLLMGDASYENRNLQGNGDIIVGHYSLESLQTTTSYISDDYYALIEEGQGERPQDLLNLGVGRIPTTDVDLAMGVVGKIATYMGLNDNSDEDMVACMSANGESAFGPWRNKVLFVSDDQDGNNQDGHRYMANSEEHSNTIRENHNAYDVVKIYPDAYLQTSTPGGERYEDATEEIARRVDEGALIVNYIGHGGERGWAHERLLTMETIEGWTNLNRLPLFMTATCELFRFDDPDLYSAGEAILFNPNGGGISLLTTTRTVYSSGNQQVNRAFFETALNKHVGRRLGDIYRDTKNSEQITSHTNSRNFSLMGDPALELAYPQESVYFTEVPDTLRALEEITIRGYVGNAEGDTLLDFNGVVAPKVFDKRTVVTTLDNDASEGPFTYEVFQSILHKGLASVTEGEFEFRFVVPRDIEFAFGSGRISGYARSGDVDAHGYSEEFVIGGTAENPVQDDEGPVVELFVNDTLFRAGDVVHEDPWLFARVFDESGINTSGNGIGHDLKAVLDGDASRPYVLNEYFTADLDTYQRGSIRFPFQNLEEGPHELELKVWDVTNNSATATTHFVVASSEAVALERVLAYPNPATDRVTFRMTGNQACRQAQVKLDVFSVSGALMYEQTFAGEVLGFTDDVMSWDLRQTGGAPVVPGVYVFRVTWENEFGESAQYGDKLVVIRPD